MIAVDREEGARVAPAPHRRATAATAVEVVSAALLLLLFAVSWNSLTSFPDPFADEGHYGAAGFSLVTSGRFTPFDVPDVPAFGPGDGIRPRATGALFGWVGGRLGYSLLTARAISFLLVWGAVLLWLPIARTLGAPAFLGALLFASSERVFWASHVFRPEAALILVNTVLVLVLVRTRPAAAAAPYWAGRGLLNGPLVLVHGNGLVSALVNSLDAVAGRPGIPRRARVVGWAAYAAGALAAVGAFYLVQVRPIGGWRAFLDQLAAARQYLPSQGVLGMIRSEVVGRWGKELFVVGASVFGKLARGVWYATALAVMARSAFGPAGPARRLATVALGTMAGYALFVHDREDIHIAEMVPFICAAVVAWLGSAGPAPARRIGAAVLAAAGLGLCLHHGWRYRPQAYTPEPEAAASAIRDYVEARAARAQPPVRAVVGEECLWFWLRETVEVVPPAKGRGGRDLEGELVVACDPSRLPYLVRCAPEYSDPSRRFAVYRCPAVAPDPHRAGAPPGSVSAPTPDGEGARAPSRPARRRR